MKDQLPGTWVEIAERSSGDTLVWMRTGASVPPSRGGRRQLELGRDGKARSMAQGASDRMEARAHGQWEAGETEFKLDLKGWEGAYEVEQMTDTEMILRRRD